MHHLEALAYAVPFEPCFEPYVVVDKTVTPVYDERFRGYGMNKASSLVVIRMISSEADTGEGVVHCMFGMRSYTGGGIETHPLLNIFLCGGCSEPCFPHQRCVDFR